MGDRLLALWVNGGSLFTADPRPETILGFKVYVAPTWATGWRWRYFQQPRIPPRARRKGTRRQWKRANARGWRLRLGPVEPDHVLHTPVGVIMTRRQYLDLKRLAEANAPYFYSGAIL